MARVLSVLLIAAALAACTPRHSETPLTYFGHKFQDCRGYPGTPFYVWLPEVTGLCGWYTSEKIRAKNINFTLKSCTRLVRKITDGRLNKPCRLAYEDGRYIEPMFKRAATRYVDLPINLELSDSTGVRQARGVYRRLPHRDILMQPFQIFMGGVRICDGTVKANFFFGGGKFQARCFNEVYRGSIDTSSVKFLKVQGMDIYTPAGARIERDTGAYIALRF